MAAATIKRGDFVLVLWHDINNPGVPWHDGNLDMAYKVAYNVCATPGFYLGRKKKFLLLACSLMIEGDGLKYCGIEAIPQGTVVSIKPIDLQALLGTEKKQQKRRELARSDT